MNKSEVSSQPLSGTVAVKSGEIYYETRGRGHPLVLIHAGFLDRRMWDEQFDSYSKNYHVIRYDVRGFGKSSKATDKYSDIEDLDNLLSHLRVGKAFIIGVSNGGRIAIDFAIKYPSKVDGLILAGSGISGRTPQSAEEDDFWRRFEETMAPQEELLKQSRFRESSEMDVDAWGRAQSPKSREKMLRIAYENARAQIENPWQHQVHPNPPGYARVSDIKAPTLVMVGDKDQQGMVFIAEDIHRKIPGSKYMVVEGADHIVNMSKPDIFDKVILGFLASVSKISSESLFPGDPA